MDVSNLVMLGSVGAAFLGIVMGLYAVSVYLGRAVAIHNLSVEAHSLRRDYTQRLAKMRGEFDSDDDVNFEYVEEEDDAPAEAVEIGEFDEPEMKQAA